MIEKIKFDLKPAQRTFEATEERASKTAKEATDAVEEWRRQLGLSWTKGKKTWGKTPS